jgi:hypothetical protein
MYARADVRAASMCGAYTASGRLFHLRDLAGRGIDEEALGPRRLPVGANLVGEHDAPVPARRDPALDEAPLGALDLGARLEAHLRARELDRLVGVDLALRGGARARGKERDSQDRGEEEELAERGVP